MDFASYIRGISHGAVIPLTVIQDGFWLTPNNVVGPDIPGADSYQERVGIGESRYDLEKDPIPVVFGAFSARNMAGP